MEPDQCIADENGEDFSIRIIKVETATTDMGSFEDKLQLCDFMTFTETPTQNLHYDPGQVPRDLEELDLQGFFKLSMSMRKLQIIVQELLKFYPTYRFGKKEGKLLGIPLQGYDGTDVTESHQVKHAVDAKCFGPNQVNFGITNIGQLLKSITAPWSVREKLTVLAYTVQLYCKHLTDGMARLGRAPHVDGGRTGESQDVSDIETPEKVCINVNEFYSKLNRNTLRYARIENLRDSYIKLEHLSSDYRINVEMSDGPLEMLKDALYNETNLSTMVRLPCINSKNGCPIKTFPNILLSHVKDCIYPSITEKAVTSKISLRGPRRRFTAMCRSYEIPLGIVFSYKQRSNQLQVKAQSLKKSQSCKYVLVMYDEKGRPKHRIQSVTSHIPHVLPMIKPVQSHLIYRIQVQDSLQLPYLDKV